MAAKQRQNFGENLEEQLAKIDPATLQYLEQLFAENAPAVQKIVQNVLDEPISQEMEKRLHKPLLPKPFRPRAPPRQRRVRKRQDLLREFDPFPPQNIRTVTDYQNEILDQYDEAKHEGEESKGRRFIRWRFIRGLEKTSHQTLWQIFERTFTQRFTSGTFTRISCATLKIIRSLCTTLTTAHLGLTTFPQRRNS